MTRSNDGRWTRQCQVCGKDYQQRKATQVTCSFACGAKLPHNTGGVRFKAGLEERRCENCNSVFLPAREKQRWCSMDCYYESDDWKQSRERANRQRQLAHAADPEHRRAENFKNNIRKYGLTVVEFEAMLAAQDGLCMICGRPPKPDGVRAASRLHIDHDHVTGHNRDLICLNCNRGLGYFKDDPALLHAAADYVERHRAARKEIARAMTRRARSMYGGSHE